MHGKRVGEGYLGFDTDPDSVVVEIIVICVNSIALAIQCVIAITAFCKMRQNPNISGHASFCFVLSFVSAFWFTLSTIITYAWDPHDEDSHFGHVLLSFSHVVSFGIFFTSLLLTFIVRLYDTFKPSVYRMSNRLIVMFVVIMTLLTVGWTFACIPAVHIGFESSLVLYVVITSLLCLYVIGSGLAVYFFVSNLSKLAKTRQVTVRNLNLDPKDIQLDGPQQRLSDLSAKYMMLYIVSIASTIVLALLSGSVNFSLRPCFYDVDLCVNLWCLYLQFGFAKQHYKKCCRCCDERCRRYRLRRTQSMIHHYSLERIKITPRESTSESDTESMNKLKGEKLECID